MSSEPADRASEPDAGVGAGPGQPSEEELRAAYEAELSRITSAEVMLQAAVSLLNIGSRRLGAPAGRPPGDPGMPAGVELDLEQVSDAIDGVRALLGVLERRLPKELGPLRDALSQLQMAYAREAQAAAGETRPGTGEATGSPTGTPAQEQGQARPPDEKGTPAADEGDRPGPAEASGRLWVPGR
jgi:hypothetical protein